MRCHLPYRTPLPVWLFASLPATFPGSELDDFPLLPGQSGHKTADTRTTQNAEQGPDRSSEGMQLHVAEQRHLRIRGDPCSI